MSVPLYVGVCTFRTMNGSLSGEIHVLGGLPRRRGARRRHRHAETESRTSLAGPSDGSGTTDGGSANTSTARSSGRTTGAGPADGRGEGSKRAPIPGGGSPGGTGDSPVKLLQPMKEMPGTPWALTKAVNEGTQIVPVIQGLLESKDEKVRLRMVELLMEAAYSENSGREEVNRSNFMGWELPRPERD